jgi:RNA polymerase sigma-70 factor (ECF subfamily)
MYDSSSQDLIARAQRGHADAVGLLYDQHHEALFRYLWLKVGERPLAEDLTGDVFVRRVAGLPRYRPMQAPFRAWLDRIAHNLVMDR